MDPYENFARSVWSQLPDEEDTRWVRNMATRPLTTHPCGDEGALIKRMLDCGLSEYEIARFAKLAAYDVAFSITYMLSDPGAGIDDMKPDRLEWALYNTGPGGKSSLDRMNGMHELLLTLDPSGRDMRPRSDAAAAT